MATVDGSLFNTTDLSQGKLKRTLVSRVSGYVGTGSRRAFPSVGGLGAGGSIELDGEASNVLETGSAVI